MKPAVPTSNKPARVGIWNGFVLALFAVYVLAVGVLAYFRVIGPEKWWLTGTLQYLPSWPLAVPGVFLLIPLLLLARRLRGAKGLILAASAVLVLWYAAGPQTGLAIHLTPHAPDATQEQPIRVLTYNVKFGHFDTSGAAQQIKDAQPNLVLLQAAPDVSLGALASVLSPRDGWTVHQSGQYVLASRWRLSDFTDLDISFPGSNHHAVRAVLHPPSGPPVTVYTVRFISPRSGLGAVRHRNLIGMEDNISGRLEEARLLARMVQETTGPVLLAGDLNAPSSSLVCRELESAGLRDAWAQAGLGWGYTYGDDTKVRHAYVRIDHIMTSREFRVASVSVGDTGGSDHRPFIADVCLPR